VCGIAGIYIKDPTVVKSHAGLERFVNRLYLGLEKRGKEASGFVAVDRAGRVVMDKAAEAASDFIKSREALPENLWYILIHTRYSTKGDPQNYLNNHPILHGTCFTTHNGSVENDDELFAKYGFQRNGEVDSEILPALFGKTGFDSAEVSKMMGEVEGKVACATIDPVRYPGKVLLVKGSYSPLHMIETPKFLVWASTTESMREAWGAVLGTPPAWKRFQYLSEHTGVIIDENGVSEVFNTEKPPIKVQRVVHRQPVGFHSSVYRNGRWEDMDDRIQQRSLYDEPTHGNACDVNQDDTIQVTKPEVKKAVALLRTNGNGVAITWESTKQRYGERWVACPICDELVKDDQDNYIKTLQRGRMCIDCASMYNKLWQQKADAITAAAIEDADEEGGFINTEKYLSTKHLERYNKWAEDEGLCHGRALESLAEISGLTVDALDFLLYRMPTNERTDPGIVELIEKLWEMYDEEYVSEWDTSAPGMREAYRTWMVSEKEDPPAKPGDAFIVNKNAKKRTKKCLFCNKKPKFCIVADKAEWDSIHYCTNHYEKCGVKGCVGTANSTRHDGIRVCHTHARSNKDVRDDTWLKKNGYEFTEVR